MTSKTQLGNKVLILTLAIIMAALSIVTRWGTLTIGADSIREKLVMSGDTSLMNQLRFSSAREQTVVVSGLSGNLSLGLFQMPYWFIGVAVIIALICLTLNLVGLTAVSRLLLFFAFTLAIISTLYIFAAHLLHGTINAGGYLMLLAVLIGFQQLRASPLLSED